MKNNKIILMIVTAVCIVAGVFGLAACDGATTPNKPSNAHNHEWATTLSANETSHWHACAVTGCTEKNDVAAHSYTDGDCVCGKVHPHIPAQTWTANDTQHWKNCTVTNCTEKLEAANHDFTSGDCVCGKQQSAATHTHSYQAMGDDTYHWQECSVANCDAKIKDRAEHDFTNGDCVCGKLHSHLAAQAWQKNDAQHWKNCYASNCTEKFEAANHDFTNGDCVCGKPHPHIPAQTWTANDVQHWKNCYASNCTEKLEVANHDFTNGDCVCGTKKATEGLAFTLNSSGDGYSVSKGTATDTEIVIPSTYNGKPVTSIWGSAFSGCSSLTNITIPNSVTSIGGYAFSGCSSLTRIDYTGDIASWCGIDGLWNLDNSKVYINSQKLTEMTSITIPSSVTSIGSNAFYYCCSLTSIIIPNSVTSIAGSVFESCNALTIYCEAASKPSGWNSSWDKKGYESYCPVVWDYMKNDIADNGYIYSVIDGVRYGIKNGAVTVARQPTNLSGSITIPTSVTYKGTNYSVTSVADSAFYNCSSLTNITIPNCITSIGWNAFAGCSSLQYNDYNNAKYLGNSSNPYVVLVSITNTSITSGVINENTKVIYGTAFVGCYNLTSITIPNGVTSIGNYAFQYCRELTNITIPNEVTSIGSYAFSGCSKLMSITIPSSVTSIGYYAFYNCNSITRITVAAENTKYHSNGDCLIETATKILILGCNNSIMPTDGSITSIGRSAFYNCSSLASIAIPDSVTSIGWEAFKNCSGLTSITMGNGVKNIGDEAFSYCSKLTRIDYTGDIASWCGISGLNELDNSKVYINGEKLTDMTSITIPNSVTSIGDYAFGGCSSLTSITFNGTKAQWNAITKGTSWNYNTGNYTIHCTDGEIAK